MNVLSLITYYEFPQTIQPWTIYRGHGAKNAAKTYITDFDKLYIYRGHGANVTKQTKSNKRNWTNTKSNERTKAVRCLTLWDAVLFDLAAHIPPSARLITTMSTHTHTHIRQYSRMAQLSTEMGQPPNGSSWAHTHTHIYGSTLGWHSCLQKRGSPLMDHHEHTHIHTYTAVL